MLYQADYTGYFGDIRLERRGRRLLEQLFRNGSKSLQAISLTRAEQKGFYYLLRSEKVSEQKLVEELAARCAKAVTGKVVLAIQDTTEVNLGAHKHRIDLQSGLGRLDSPHAGDFGFKLHPSIVVDAASCFPLGIADVYVWNRPMEKHPKVERRYKQLPIAQKESRKWLKVSEHTKTCLNQAAAVVIIQDREGDIFEQFKAVPDDHTFVLIRSRTNRNLENGGKLWQHLSAAAPAGSYELLVDSDSHSQTPARKILLEVRFAQLELAAPKSGKYKDRPQVVYAVEAREVSSEPALTAGVPVHWRLLTTWPVHDYQSARMIIEWYSCRWLIEQVFSMLKKEGFDIEGSELEQGWAIRKLSVMLLDTVIRLLQMYIAYQMPEGEEVDIDVCFEQQEQRCLQAVNSQIAAGKTATLTNPFQPAGLKWAVWVIARLGGWKGYYSQRPPGMTTLIRGLNRFCQLYDGWTLLLDTT
jgi:hypothetical protein